MTVPPRSLRQQRAPRASRPRSISRPVALRCAKSGHDHHLSSSARRQPRGRPRCWSGSRCSIGSCRCGSVPRCCSGSCSAGLFPGLNDSLDRVRIGTVSLPIAIGLLLMMYPVLAKVRYDDLGHVTGDRRLLATSLVLNWVVGPALMFTLAWLFLPDLPEYRTGLIIVGLARCIAMVLIWNDLACGDREAGRRARRAQLAVPDRRPTAVLGYFYLELLPGLARARQRPSTCRVDGHDRRAVAVFLGIPLVAGYLTRPSGRSPHEAASGTRSKFLPRIGPVALYGLLFTVVVLFALQGDKITNDPLDVARIAAPAARLLRDHVDRRVRRSAAAAVRPTRASASVAFTAAGNNFELAIAVAIGVFGVTSGASPRRCRRPAHRGARARRRSSTSRCGPAAASFRPRRSTHELLRLRRRGAYRDAVAVCADCGAAVCVEHAVARPALAHPHPRHQPRRACRTAGPAHPLRDLPRRARRPRRCRR